MQIKYVVFRRLLICYLSFIIVTAFCLSQVIYSVMSKRYTDTLISHQRETFIQADRIIDDVNNQIDGMISYITTSSKGFSSLYGVKTDYLNDYQLSLSLKMNQFDYSPIWSIAIYNANTDHILSSQKMPDTFLASLKEGKFTNRKEIVSIPRLNRKTSGQYEDQLALVSNPGTFISDSKADSLIIFSLNIDYLSEKLNNLSLGPQKIYLISSNGIILSDGNDPDFFLSDEYRTLLFHLQEEVASEGDFTTKIQNERNIFLFRDTVLADCVLVSRTSLDQITLPLSALRNTVNLLTIFSTLVVCGIGTFIIYRLYYKPVRSLLNTMNCIDPEMQGTRQVNEFSLLNDSFLNIREEVSALKSSAEGALASIRKSYLSSLIYGDTKGANDLLNSVNILDTILNGPNYAVCVIRKELYSEEDEESFISFLLSAVDGDELHSDIVMMKEDETTLLLQFGNINDSQLDNLIQQAQDKAAEEEIACSFYLGNTTKNSRELASSHEKAKIAAEYHYIYGDNCFVTYRSIAQRENVICEYPQEMEYKLLQAVHLGDTELCCQCLEKIEKDFRSCSAKTAINFTKRLYFKVLGQDCNETEDETLDSILGAIRDFCLQVNDQNKNAKSGEYYQFSETLLAYIRDNLSNSTFGIQNVAEQFKISVSQVSRLLKKYQATNFVSYLTKVRLDKACELMRTGELSIQEISQQTGFNSPNYFSTTFKRYFGISPKRYLQVSTSVNPESDENSDI